MKIESVWECGSDGAVFLHLLNSMIHCVGRVSEVSSSREENVRLTTVQNTEEKFVLLSHYMDRIKVNFQQDLAIYPHKTEMLFCYYWLAAYASIMERGMSGNTFPVFFFQKGKSTQYQ